MSDQDKTDKDPYALVSEAAEILRQQANLDPDGKSLIEELDEQEKQNKAPSDYTIAEHILAVQEDILHELQKQDAAALNDAKARQALATQIQELLDTQQQNQALLQQVLENQKPAGIFKRAAIGTLKAAGLAAIFTGALYFNDEDNRNAALEHSQNFIQSNILHHFDR